MLRPLAQLAPADAIVPGWRRLASPRLALVLAAAALVWLGLAVALSALTHNLTFAQNIPLLIAIPPFGIVGGIVAYRQPRNPIGWILLLMSFGSLAGLDAAMYALLRYYHGYHHLPLAVVAAAAAPVEWMSVLVLLPLPIMLFPDGRLPSSRWRWAMIAYAAGTVIWISGIVAMEIDALFLRPIDVDSGGSLQLVDHPSGAWNTLSFTLSLPVVGYLAFVIAAITVQVRAFRRARGAVRQQLEWLLAGGAICSLGLALALAGGKNQTGFLADLGNGGLAATAALPAAIGIGILKYRLYEIDRLISRTISYTIVTGLLAAVFLGLVLLATRALPFSSPVGVAAATLAAAALFTPAPPPHATARRSPLQPCPLRRGGDRRRLLGPPPRRRRHRDGARRTGARGRARGRAGPRLDLGRTRGRVVSLRRA